MSTTSSFAPIPGSERMHGYRCQVTESGYTVEVVREYAGEWTVFVQAHGVTVNSPVERVPYPMAMKVGRAHVTAIRKHLAVRGALAIAHS